MFKNKNKKQNKNGFSLVEGIVAVGVFLIIMTSLFSLFHNVYGAIRNNKARIVANGIAMEQLEIMRGMDYDNVRTVDGWSPPGLIPNNRTINRSGVDFAVQIDIGTADDLYDGQSPADTLPLDYKKARVKVSWTSLVSGNTETVAMSTNIVPPGVEGLTAGKGGILVKVFNASGIPVYDLATTPEGASVSLTANGVNLSGSTDPNGNMLFLDLDPSDFDPPGPGGPIGNYRIVVSKAGYNSEQTYTVDENVASPTYNPNPTKPDAIVAEGVLTQVGFSIDRVSDIIIRTTSYENPDNWQVNQTGLGSTSQTDIALDIDSGDNIILAWRDDRQGGGNVDRVYAQKYKYNSGTGVFDKLWPADVDISGANNREKPRVAVFGTDYFYAIWNSMTGGNKEIYLKKLDSSNGNVIWGGVKLNVGGESSDQTKADLAVLKTISYEGDVYAVWQDARNGNWDVYAQRGRSSDGNAVWSADDIKVHIDSNANQLNPRVAVDNDDNLYVVWEDGRDGNEDIYWMKFKPNGTKFTGVGEFGASEKRVNNDDPSLDQYEPSIVFDGADYFYIAWADKRNSQPDIYAQKFDKNGVAQWPAEVKINDDSLSDAWRTKPAVAYSPVGQSGPAPALYFSWEDTRNGTPDVYSTKINPADGARLWTYDLIMNGEAANVQGAPDVVADSEGYGITTWQDERSGDFDIYAARYKELGALAGKSVNIVVTGTKLRGTYPNATPPPDNLPIYKGLPQIPANPNCWGTNMTGCTITTDASGNYNLTGIEWDNYSFAADASHYIVSTDQPVPLEVGPNQTIGNGQAKTIVINVEP